MAIAVDNAVRSGYSFEEALGMSYMQLEMVSELSARHRRNEMRIDAAAARIGANASKKEWTKFVDEEDE